MLLHCRAVTCPCNSAVAHTRALWLHLQDVAAWAPSALWTLGVEGLFYGQRFGLKFCLNLAVWLICIFIHSRNN